MHRKWIRPYKYKYNHVLSSFSQKFLLFGKMYIHTYVYVYQYNIRSLISRQRAKATLFKYFVHSICLLYRRITVSKYKLKHMVVTIVVLVAFVKQLAD